MSNKVLSGFLNIDGIFYECSFGEHHTLIKENKISQSSIHVGTQYSDTFSMQDSGPIVLNDRTKQKQWYELNKAKLNDEQKRKIEFIFNFESNLLKENNIYKEPTF